MVTIRLIFRAVFEQPTGPLNPMGCPLPGPCPVEVFNRGEFWYARSLASASRPVYTKLPKYSSSDAAKAHIAQYCFARQVEPWQIWGEDPGSGECRMLTPYEVCDLGDGRGGLYQPKDRLHIFNPKDIPEEAKKDRIPPAACGARGLNADRFISNKANVQPSCKECAEVWKREYQGK